MSLLGWLIWAARASAQFNDTYRFVFTSADGLCDFDGASVAFGGSPFNPFTLDSETGYRTSAGRSSGGSGVWFVGTGITVEGRGLWKPNSPNDKDPADPVHAFLYQTNQDWQPVLDTPNFFNISADKMPAIDVHGKELRSWELRIVHTASGRMEFHNMTVDVPVKTQAPSKEALEEQATFVPVIQGGKVNPTMSMGFTTKMNQFRDMWSQRDNRTYTLPSPEDQTRPRFVPGNVTPQPSQQPQQGQSPTSQSQQSQESTPPQSQMQSQTPAPTQSQSEGQAQPQVRRRHEPHLKRLDIPHEIIDGALLLKNGTELSYKVPVATTLIRVLGPVGMNRTAFGSQCYADLDPVPSWWVNSSFPLSASQKVMRADNRTLFLLPVDPDVRTTVRVGPLGLDATCYVSGFTSYPFHYNYTLADLIATNGTNTAGNKTTPPSTMQSSDPPISTSSSSSHSKTGMIVGIVVGVVGGLLLAALLAWFCLRSRKSDEPDDIDPYLISEKDLYRNASWAPDGDSHLPPPAPREGESRPRGPRVVQEEDADDVVEYLPPRYRERTLPNTPEPLSTPPLSTPDIGSSHENTNTTQLAIPEGAERPTLKEEYLKNLGIAPGAVESSVSKVPHSQGSPTSASSAPLLKRAYGRLFGSGPPSEAGPSQSKDWNDDVKVRDESLS